MMANPEWTDPSDWNDKPTRRPRALLGIDGNCGFALLGDNIQEGEAEFEPIEGYSGGLLNSVTSRAAEIAIGRAYKRLKDRIDYPISYALHDSHPRAC